MKSFYKARIILYQNQAKIVQKKKKTTDQSIFLMNIDTCIPNKILASRIQKYIEVKITVTKLNLLQEWNVGLAFKNQATQSII